MKPKRGKLLRSCCVALAGLAALLALQFALYHFNTGNLLAVVMFFAVYGLIVWGMIAGLERAAMDATEVNKATSPNMLIIVDGGSPRHR